ncbi:hypothetical protein PSTG_18892 [Puccinia striiformis f. sp. tritici PST-78]|uniref:Myb/SANT-like domain-containing protein n=1 Tax=Puccinia striiformis f. sp. tritici PST-78 TaxID=1165861 RepID=A0A0L0UKV0_9BASI|nr:hypothetical protein PSTG_18898 [Puccinia striiformis f. sp. tritici PST-78]KNE87717.1 hypothetical protein PSTG_18892 [Puccinia striiformis f. sp. tritici PST-78]
MFDRFEITFDNKQLKNQKGAIRKLYVDLKFLKNQSGFGWNAATGMVTADKGDLERAYRGPSKTEICEPSRDDYPLV